MSLNQLIEKYKGATIGVLGSGPSLREYAHMINSCDLIIATNGSLRALKPKEHKIDFFIYGDISAPKRQWFHDSTKFEGKTRKRCTRILPNFLLPFDEIVLPDPKKRYPLKKAVKEFRDSLTYYDNYIHFDLLKTEKIPLTNGLIFKYNDSIETLNLERKKNPSLTRGGTITGTASQLAYLMGAKKIILFGCGFNNLEGSGNYSYDSKGEFGITTNLQKENMDKILSTLIKKGTSVECLGKTNLTSPKITY